MASDFTVYIIVNRVNWKVYAGLTRISMEKRWKKHCSNARSGNPLPLYGAIRKHGPQAFEIIRISDGTDLRMLNEMEVHFISKYRSMDPKYGYNLTRGGDGVSGTDEVSERIRKSKLGKTRSEETRRKISEALKGRKVGGALRPSVWREKRKQERRARKEQSKAKSNGGAMPLPKVVAEQISDLLNSQNQLTVPYTASKIIDHQDRYIVRYDDNGKVLGAVEVKKVQWYQCEIDHLSVDPKSKRQGIGSRLLREAEARACDMGARIAQCTIRVGNDASEGLFKKYGYTPTVTFLNRENGNQVAVYQKVLECTHGHADR
jgi:group I intron endonuclease